MKSCLSLFIAIFALLHAGGIQAQQLRPVTVRGQMVDKDSRLVLYPASARNLSSRQSVFTDKGGYYKLDGRQNDTIVLSYIGYHADTFVVRQLSGTEVHNGELRIEEHFLQGVEITSRYNAYQLDSIARANEFRHILELPDRDLVDKSKRAEGFGIIFSPFTRYSQKEKDKRKFKEQFSQNEIDEYIEFRYSKQFVSKVTGLSGDSLLNFMNKNTPSYQQLRVMPNEDLIYWTTDRYRTWVNKK
ncbi:carboxypeptidase-like regulatory domain-containing protein [Chitinophaga horti]|uniref:Carboxypeptidase-like regulatory domain-containing protein n=1 Tax=Chitinophaga horti TaxID=2920382 RepID=A0ABY6J2N9_9BACT|nr:carboxypeptidase-like regulatory domain-containing protein [Chitinophaga horti]UYQ93938.1 carboxypeptidase-like regulatory domain-containing protein [Chitinophaga horti]